MHPSIRLSSFFLEVYSEKSFPSVVAGHPDERNLCTCDNIGSLPHLSIPGHGLLDFAGPYLGHMYLVVVDAHSKWMDVILMTSISSAKMIEKLRIVFATHDIPQKVVTNNGTSFTSHELEFMSKNGIIYITLAPYRPSTNGLAEHAVQSFK